MGPRFAYREFVQWLGELRFAFAPESLGSDGGAEFERLAPLVNYIGKRGGFIQFRGWERCGSLDAGFTQRWDSAGLMAPDRAHMAALDDFGPEASFDVLNSYSEKGMKRGKHREFRETLIPLGAVNQGAGFTLYARATAEGRAE